MPSPCLKAAAPGMFEAMTTEPGTTSSDDAEVDRDDADQQDDSSSTEDQASDMDYEGDTPN